MSWIKQNWIKRVRELINNHRIISILLAPVLAYYFFVAFIFTGAGVNKIYDLATISSNVPTSAIANPDPKQMSSEESADMLKVNNWIIFHQSLPRFEDYEVKVYPIPPKPLVNHQSSPYAMKYWTVTEDMASRSETWDESGRRWSPRDTYDMGGHYLISRYGTGNPNVLIIDGLSGRVFHELGGIFVEHYRNSSLVIFDPFDIDCFSSDGNYEPCNPGEGNPRYTRWDGEQFITICEPIVKQWKLISCGKNNK